MDIKERLQQIDSLQRAHTFATHKRTVPRAESNLEITMDGETVQNAFGAVYRIQKDYPLSYLHGDTKISSLLKMHQSLLALVGKNKDLSEISLNKIIFIDTETTGLAGGSGTTAFLIGVGYFLKKSFRIQQFFMRDFNEEKALLYELTQHIEKFDLIVSYNGKSFDVPLLRTRSILQRMDNAFLKTEHLDLLHAVRRLWKHRLLDCSLSTAEKEITHVERSGDIPGYMIPYIYFQFLHERDARPLGPVFYHNQQDILSMVALLAKALQLFKNPIQKCSDSQEVISICKVYEALGEFENSIELYREYLKTNSERNNRKELLIRIAFNYKKLGRWNDAAVAWNECISAESYHPLPYIELAKHFEHRERNFSKAKILVKKALSEIEIVDGLNRRVDWGFYRENLEYRRQRLARKLTP